MDNKINASSIVSDASPDEEHSPFYIDNKAICQEWEAFVNQLGGSIKGSFSAWTLKMCAHLPTQGNWKVDISKSSLSTSTLFLAPEKSIIEQTKFEASEINLGEFAIKIWESSLWSSLRMKINPNINRLNDQLVIAINGKPNQKGVELIEKMKLIPTDYRLASLNYNPAQKAVKITFNSIVRDYTLVESLISPSC